MGMTGPILSRLGRVLAAAMTFALVIAVPPPTKARAADVVRLAVTELEGLEEVQREFGKFRDLLIRQTGVQFEFYPVSSRTVAVEALNSKKVDFVLTGPAEYVVFRARTSAEPVVGFSRLDYFCSVIVLGDSPVTSLADLRERRMALGDVGSTSKHLAPVQMLKDQGLDPRRDVQLVHTSIKLGWEALKRGTVAAFATTNDKYLAMRGAETELPPAGFRVIARGPDLPHDVLVVRPGMDQAIVRNVRQAILANSAQLVSAILTGEDNQKYHGMGFVLNIRDSDYNCVREMYRAAGYPQFAKFVGED